MFDYELIVSGQHERNASANFAKPIILQGPGFTPYPSPLNPPLQEPHQSLFDIMCIKRKQWLKIRHAFFT